MCQLKSNGGSPCKSSCHQAAAYTRSDICSLLVTAGASLLVKDNEARTARMLAEASGADTCLLSYLESQGLTIIM